MTVVVDPASAPAARVTCAAVWPRLRGQPLVQRLAGSLRAGQEELA